MSEYNLLETASGFYVCRKAADEKLRLCHPNGISEDAAKRFLDDLASHSCPLDVSYTGEASHLDEHAAEVYDLAVRIKRDLNEFQERDDPPLDCFAMALYLAEKRPWDFPRKDFQSGDTDESELPF